MADLVLEAARARGVDVEVVEWPGGEPVLVDLPVSDHLLRAVRRGTRKSLPLGVTGASSRWCGLPYGSIVLARSGDASQRVIAGPARYDVKKGE